MKRREFLKEATLGLAAGWAVARLSRPLEVLAGPPEMRLALLADAHLKSGAGHSPEARALARAVAEIRALRPPPDLVLFAGDLADSGDPRALALGREILADLPAPLLMVPGEGDGPGGQGLRGAPVGSWGRRFGEPRFSQACRGVHLLGLETALRRTPAGPVFAVGGEQRRWLARELSRLNPQTPLIVLSHAPLGRLFHPWQQWTGDAARVMGLLAGFQSVTCLHGHTHRPIGQGPGSSGEINLGYVLLTENRKPKTENHLFHQALPATAWPLPPAAQGTPGELRPGLGPRECGWGLLTLRQDHLCQFLPHLWQV
jgi:predicted phosphodiesterase